MKFLCVLCALCVSAVKGQPLYEFAVDQDRLAGAADFSALNHPLGPADRIFVRDGHFYRVGPDLQPNTADDERVRMFGVNLAFGANFPEPADAARIAARLRKLGVNLVRLHHMDTSPDRDPGQARSLLTTGPYPALNPVSVARLRNFLDALRAAGVYVNLNLHVGYVFRPDVDKVPALPGGMPMPRLGKPLHIFYPRMVELQTEYTRKVIQALKLKGDPVLAMVEIDNESSLLEAWQRGTLERYALGEYKAELDRQWHAFQRKTGDYALFLTDRDRAYLERMQAAVRASADALVPVAGTQMNYGGLLNLDSQAGLSYQDNHFYIDHYNFPHTAWDPQDWRIRDSSSVGAGLQAFLNMAAGREAGRPYTVSEFNQPWPNRQAAEIDPTLAAFAAFQDWDAIMHFAYEHGRNWDTRVPSGFNIDGDWTKWPNIGQSAWLFRTAAVAPAPQQVTIPVSREMQLRSASEKHLTSVAAALSAAGYDPAVALTKRLAIAKAGQSAGLPAESGPAPEITYDRESKLFVIDAPRAAGVFGFAGTKKVGTRAMDVELAPSARGFVSMLLTPLDNQPLGSSRHMLLTIPGCTLGTQPGSDPPRAQKLIPYEGAADWFTLEPRPGSGKPSGSRDGGQAPVWMERVESFVTLHTAAPVRVHPLDGAGRTLPPLPANATEKVKDGWRVHLQAGGQTFAPWYEVRIEGGSMRLSAPRK